MNTGAAKRIVDKVFSRVHYDPTVPSIDPALVGGLFTVVERGSGGGVVVGEADYYYDNDDAPPRKFRIVPLLKKMEKERTKIMADMEAEHERFVAKTKAPGDYVAERVRILGEKGKEPLLLPTTAAAAVPPPPPLVAAGPPPPPLSSTGGGKRKGARMIFPTLVNNNDS